MPQSFGKLIRNRFRSRVCLLRITVREFAPMVSPSEFQTNVEEVNELVFRQAEPAEATIIRRVMKLKHWVGPMFHFCSSIKRIAYHARKPCGDAMLAI